MATAQVLPVIGGVGETSYANNSSFQRRVISEVRSILEESITRMYSTSIPNCLKVADLGCSSGPNALLVPSGIVDIVDNISRNLNQEPPTLQFFLNDLCGNDFDTIFELLPGFYKRIQAEKGDKFGRCFINATPGSFYGRLFPSNSMHFFHSSSSLHWLSKVPTGLAQGKEFLNKGNIYLTNRSPPAVHKAYLEQFQDDFKLFLKSRSEELVPGGGMLLTFSGRDETCEIRSHWGLLGMALNDMVTQGLIEEAKLDSFNMPRYGPTAEEVKQVIEAEGSFTLQKLETIKLGWDAGPHESSLDCVVDTNMTAEFIAKHVRATAEPFLKAQFGEGIMDELFIRFRKKVVKQLEVEKEEHVNLVMFMIKKA